MHDMLAIAKFFLFVLIYFCNFLVHFLCLKVADAVFICCGVYTALDVCSFNFFGKKLI